MSSSTSSNNMNIGLGSYKTTYEYDDVVNMEKNNNISTGIISPSAIGLSLGNTTKLDYGDSSSNSFPHNKITCKINSSSSSTHPTKRSRASYQNMQNPCCQVEGCNLDLRSAKDYHRRHRICESHSKSPKVVVAGMERRFCQQCSRFHDLSEFDDKKRSCRRRLSDHNARRRRVQPDSMQLNSAGLSSALYDHRANNMLLNGLPISLSNSTWENGGSSARDSLIRPSLCFSGDHIHNPISSLQTTSTFPRVLGQCLHAPTSNNSTIVPDLLSANSLLSSNSWSFNEGKIGNSMEGLVHGNYITNPAGSDYNNIILNPDEQGPHVSFLHEYQLLSKTPENNYF